MRSPTSRVATPPARWLLSHDTLDLTNGLTPGRCVESGMSLPGYKFGFVYETVSNPSPLLSVKDVALKLRMSPQRVRQLLASRDLEGQQVGKTWVVDPNSVRRYLLEHGKATIAPTAVRSVPKNQMKVLSFFSGAMGLDQGLERAGLHTILACENDRASRDTIVANRPDIPLLGDIWQYDATEIRSIAGLGAHEDIDVVAGGPPCQSFSTAGARRGFDDVRGNVFLHFIHLIRELSPKYAVLENVRGLLSMKIQPSSSDSIVDEDAGELVGIPGGALIYVVGLLEKAGYAVSFNLYNAANFGSPQVRERVVLICSRDGGRVPFLKPTHSSDPAFGLPAWRTFREATEGLVEEESLHLEFPENRLKYFRLLESGQYWRHLPKDMQPEALGKAYYLGGGKTGFLRRLAWDKPSPTLVTHPAMPATDLAHPELDRPLSVQEYKRLQDFPDDWIIEGSLIEKYRQLGNAVPLRLGESIGTALRQHAAGLTWDEPIEFPYSRYRNTSDQTLSGAVQRAISQRRTNELALFE